MIVKVKSAITGKINVRDIPDLDEDMLGLWQAGELIETAMPDLSDADKAFLISGITDEEWAKAFVE